MNITSNRPPSLVLNTRAAKIILILVLANSLLMDAFSQCPNLDCGIEIASGECPSPAGHPCYPPPQSPNCTAEDVKILDVYLATDSDGTCLTTADCESLADGEAIDVFVCIVFCSNNSSTRQGIYVGGTVMGMTSGTSLDIDHCFDLLLEQNVPKIACVPAPSTYLWDCSEALVLKNALTVWGTGSGAVCPVGGGAGADVICGSTNKAKCRCYGDIQVTTPLRADFTWDQCVDFGDPTGLVQFSGQAMGGASPYMYDWDFGDLSTLNNTNPASRQYTTSGPFTVMLTVTDNLGTSTVATHEITLETCCEFSVDCPMNLDLGAYDCNNLGNIPAPPTDAASAAAAPYNITIGTNPCGIVRAYSADNPSVNICAATDQTIMRTVTVFDDSGDGMGGAPDGILNLGEEFMNCVFTYDILVDDVDPVITASGSVADGADLGCNPSAADIEAALGTATASDNCSVGDPTSTDDAVTGDACTKSQTRRFNVMDACDNPATEVTRTITWSTDTEAPVITASGSVADGADLGCNPSAADIEAALGTATASDNCSVGDPTSTDDAVTGDACTKSQTRRFNVMDACDNPATEVTRTITWSTDTEAPVITASGSVADGADLGCNPSAVDIEAALGTATASDNCSVGDPTSTDDAVTGDACTKSQTRRFNVMDACDNPATEVTRTITWSTDTEAPVITASGSVADGADLGCNPSAADIEAALGTATASDNCSVGDPTSTDDAVTGDACTKSQTRRFNVIDACDNPATEVTRTITWSTDTEAPVITASGSVDDGADLGCNPSAADIEAALGTATASDNCSVGDPTSTDDAVTGDACTKSQTRRFNVMDACDNPATEVTRTITWSTDTEAPVITASGSVDDGADLGCNPSAADIEAALGTATASDNCSVGDPTSTDDAVTGDACTKSQTRRFNVMDACDNPATEVTRTITWSTDTEAPVIAASGSVADGADLGCNPSAADIEAALGTATASDNCSVGDPTSTDDAVTGDACTKSQTRRFNVMDACDNPATEVTRTITWSTDTEAPVITASGSVDDGADLGCNPTASVIDAALGSATATDNCSVGAVTASDGDVSGDPCLRSQTRSFTVMDACGNPALEVTRTVTWTEDTQDPTFTNCTNDVVTDPIDLGTDAPDENAAIDAVGIPSDACGFGPNVASAVGGPITDGCIKSQTWTVTIADQCGNTGSCQVTFLWTGPPLVCLPPDVTDADCNAEATGSATVNVSGGTPAYTYLWSDGQTSQTATGLSAGNYTVTVSDAEGCEIVCDATVSEASALTASILAFCVEEEALINLIAGASGGTGPYGFSWQGPEGFTSTDPGLSNVAQGTYTLVVTDANGCTFTTSETKDDCCDMGSLLLAAPAAQASCHNGASPPTAADVPPPIALAVLMNDLQVMGNCVSMAELLVQSDVTGPVVDGALYTFTRTYYVSAPNALPAQANEMITILYDPLPPVLSGLPEDLVLTCGSELPEVSPVTGYDNVSFDVPVQVSENIAGLNCSGYLVERTYTASDGCGNMVTGTQLITFIDDEAPTLVVPGDTTIYCPGEIPPADYISATDNCSAFDLSFDEKTTELDNCDYILTRTWTAMDACGNETIATQSITFHDRTGPSIVVTNPMLAGLSLGDEMITYGCDDPRVVMEDVTISDDCCGIAESAAEDKLIASHTCDVFGYFRKWKCLWWATDEAGNYSEFYFYVVQYDTAAPVLHNVPGYLEVSCDSIIPTPDTTVYAEDDCALTSHLLFEEDTVYDASNPSSFALIRTWSAEDFCDNKSEAVQIIAVCGFDTLLISSSIGNQVWEDVNANGLQDSLESGINDVTVYLYNQDILNQDGWYLVDSTKTASKDGLSGQFLFKYLHPGEYRVRFKQMEMLSFTTVNAGTDEALDSDADPETGMTDPIYILTNEDADYVDAGMRLGVIKPINVDEEKIKVQPCESGDCMDDDLQLKVFPNPFSDEISLEYSVDSNTEMHLEVFDALGRSLKTIRSSAVTGRNQEKILLNKLDSGVYYVRIKAGARSGYKMIIKAR